MKIKLSLLKSTLHDSNSFFEENKLWIQSIEEKLNTKIIITSLEDYDCDIKLIFIASGGSEGLFLSQIDSLKPPYYLLTTGANNSLAASLEILTYLNCNHLEGEILHGSAFTVAERIKSILTLKKENYTKLGVIGKPSDWLISSIPDYNLVKKIFGIELVNIDLEKTVHYFHESKIKNILQVNYFNQQEIDSATRFYEALHQVVSEYNLKGATIRCFDLLTKIKMTGCLALAKLNEEGIIGTCEGDIMALITMFLIKQRYNQSSFQCNPSLINIEENSVVLAHCTLPFDMVDSYKFDTHFESKIGVAIKGKLKKQKVTVARISADLSHYYVGRGEIIENLNDLSLCRTQIKVKMDTDISTLLKNPCGNHHIVFYGDHALDFAEYLDNILK